MGGWRGGDRAAMGQAEAGGAECHEKGSASVMFHRTWQQVPRNPETVIVWGKGQLGAGGTKSRLES